MEGQNGGLTIVEAMKEIKLLNKQCADLRTKVGEHCCDYNIETPVYDDQRATVQGWLASHHDRVQRIADLKRRLTATNLATEVPIEIAGSKVTRSITEWIARRSQLAQMEAQIWNCLRDKGLKADLQLPASATGADNTKIELRRYYSPEERDRKVEEYSEEPTRIDQAMEYINATTPLVA